MASLGSNESVCGYIRRITFHNPDNGYTIARMEVSGQREEVVIVGVMAMPREGDHFRIIGEWVRHPRYGRQFRLDSYDQIYPSTLDGIEKYLGSGMIKGVGPVSARRIVAHFGKETLNVIDEDVQRLREVPKLGARRVTLIAAAWGEQRQVKDVMVFLQSHGVTTGYAVKIFKQYGRDAISRVQSNPYCLERDIVGIGFQLADRIARNVGFAVDSVERLQAGVRYLLERCADEGHVFMPLVELIEKGCEILGVNAILLASALERLREDDGVVTEGVRYYLPPLSHAEMGAASSLRRLLCTPAAVVLERPQFVADDLELAPNQVEAVDVAAVAKVMVLTGGPGTGKTMVTKEILRLFDHNEQRVALCSPTGRAAKRMAEATSRPAMTIHRLLEYAPSEGGFRKNYDDRLDVDALIVDEASMIDVVLVNALCRALPDTARLIMVGDVDQLPSVGPGNVLRDIIDSGTVPVVRLNRIFRQAESSRIVVNAHRINRGMAPLVDNQRDGDFFFLEAGDSASVVDLIEDLCARRLPAHGPWDPLRHIQVLVPMYRGETGALNLNRRLQQRLNPQGCSLRQGDSEFRVGDRVIQVRNDYDRGVFNGDLGIVTAVDGDEEALQVQFDQMVDYDCGRLDELQLAYAISTHRSQGCEFPVVVMPLTTQHYVMLQRNLLYTAVTRARELVVIVGTQRALDLAVANDGVTRRNTTLRERLRGELDKSLNSQRGYTDEIPN